MNFGRYAITMVILIMVSVLYDRFKKKNGITDEVNHYDAVQKYLLNESSGENNPSSLANSSKPLLWLHMDYEVNARHWLSFNSRNSKCLNQPYILLILKTIINKCGNSFNICLIDDNSFEKILPEWGIDLSRIANPLKEHYRNLGLTKILYKYGGLLVPNTFICFKNLDTLYNSINDKPIIGEFKNRNVTATYKDFCPDMRFLGCKKNCEVIKQFILFMEKVMLHDSTNEMDFLGEKSCWCSSQIAQNKMTLVNGRTLGTRQNNNNAVFIEELVNNGYINFCDTAMGVYVPSDELLKRKMLNWFVRMSPEQVLKSNTNIGKYILINSENQ
jgi:hypothetical protein